MAGFDPSQPSVHEPLPDFARGTMTAPAQGAPDPPQTNTSPERDERQQAMAAEGVAGVTSERGNSDFDDEILPRNAFDYRAEESFCAMRTLDDWCNPNSLYMVTPTYAFLLTCRTLYSRCVADCLLALKHIQVSISRLMEFYVKIDPRSRYLVPHVDIGGLIVISQAMTTQAHAAPATFTALDHVRDFLVEPIFNSIKMSKFRTDTARVFLDRLCHEFLLARHGLQCNLSADSIKEYLRGIFELLDPQVVMDEDSILWWI